MYYTRLIEKKIKRVLKSSGAVLITGPKFCGKTTTSMLFQNSFIKLNTKKVIELASINPRDVLTGDKPRLIDEWQTVPDIWNQVKNDLDDSYEFGKYILTGSTTPIRSDDIYHSGAGRITAISMNTMSLFESGESTGKVSLYGLLSDESGFPTDFVEHSTLEDVAYYICRGGWPISVVSSGDRDIALDITKNYYNSLFIFEGSENEQFRNKKPEVLKMLLRSYARNISSGASQKTIRDDVIQSDERTFDQKTMAEYLNALRDLFIIRDLEAWTPNIRSKTSIRSTPTRHFVDTSIACRALNISPSDLVSDPESFGLMFEDMAVRDLSVYASVNDGEIRHYRDNTGLECDAVVHYPDGRWGAIEIKLGGEKRIEEGAASLLRLKNKISNKSNEAAPSFMMVLTAVGQLYRRPDGIYVVPITTLKE